MTRYHKLTTEAYSPGQITLSKRKGWLHSFLYQLFPDRCLFCRDIIPISSLNPLCSTCQKNYSAGGRICPNCESFFREEPPCSCIVKSISLEGLFFAALYDQSWRKLIHELKYRNRRAVIRPLAIWLAFEILNNRYCKPDLIVPVPLHPVRERERGYNQAALLARNMAQVLKVPWRGNLLFKAINTRSQTSISRYDRQSNVRGVFKCRPEKYNKSTILLVDDVYSTGATMKEAALALKNKTGARVFGAAIAYNPNIRAIQRTGFYAGLEKW